MALNILRTIAKIMQSKVLQRDVEAVREMSLMVKKSPIRNSKLEQIHNQPKNLKAMLSC